MSPRLLDLFCGAGGAAMGYARAGFDVIGVDLHPQPRYPFPFVQGDALVPPLDLGDFDVIHASPPCQAYAVGRDRTRDHPDLYEPTRDLLEATGRPWVIENVIGAPYRSGIRLCGSMFGARFRRHRVFESDRLLLAPACDHLSQGEPLGAYGHGGGTHLRPSGTSRGRRLARSTFPDLLGVPWMIPDEAVEAVPPVYTELIGRQLREML